MPVKIYFLWENENMKTNFHHERISLAITRIYFSLIYALFSFHLSLCLHQKSYLNPILNFILFRLIAILYLLFHFPLIFSRLDVCYCLLYLYAIVIILFEYYGYSLTPLRIVRIFAFNFQTRLWFFPFNEVSGCVYFFRCFIGISWFFAMFRYLLCFDISNVSLYIIM